MSQEKVERRKKEKENRKKIMKQEKLKALATKCAIVLVIVIAFGWIGYSGYSVVQKNKPVEAVSVNLDSINNYMAGLSTDTAQ